MLGAKNPYFYFVSAFVCVIIAFDGGVESLSAFETAVSRIQETGMGILVYTLISFFLWPQNTKAVLDDASRKLISVQSQLFQSCRDILSNDNTASDSGQLRIQQGQLLNQFGQALDGAEADSYEVWDMRHQWQRFRQLSSELGEALDSWRTTLGDVRQLNLPGLLPNLEAVCSELGTRFEHIEQVLIGDASEHTPRPITVEIDRAKIHKLNHFQEAALVTTKAQLERVEFLSQALLDCVATIRGGQQENSMQTDIEFNNNQVSFDPDRFGAAVRVLAGMWISFLIWIYINPPAAQLMIILVITLGMAVAQMPWVPVWKFFLPLALSAVFAGIIYLFVMPNLTGYAELGLLIFVVTFAFLYLFAEQRLMLLRTIGLALFLLFISVQNQQTYSFPAYANQVVMVLVANFVLVIASHIPTSARPEKAFLRLLNRFVQRVDFLLSHLSLDRRQLSWLERQKMVYYQNDLFVLPQKISVWGKQIDYQVFPENSPEQVQEIIDSIDMLARRMKMLIDARQYTQANSLTNELLQEVSAWRNAVQQSLRASSPDRSVSLRANRQKALSVNLKKLEDRISSTFDPTREEALRDQDYKNFYRLLGAFRLMSEATIAHSRLAADINWAQWKEARF
jgi:uncharacterized membrane protein YccC